MGEKANLRIKQLSQELANVINKYDFPIEVKRLVLFMLYTEVKEMADEAIYHENIDETHTAQLSKEVKADEQSVQQDNVGELSE